MPNNKDLKRLVRARMAETQENYTQALSAVLSSPALEPVPEPWHISGTHRGSYLAGLMPSGSSYNGSRVVRLRLRTGIAEPAGFGTLMQSISATRYAGRRVRFAAAIRTREVSDWAGLWLRIDTSSGTDQIDNMHDRALRQSTEWQQAAVVLDVSHDATSLHFGVLLSGAGAVDLAQPRFEAVGPEVPVTLKPPAPLPDEPQALNFGGLPAGYQREWISARKYLSYSSSISPSACSLSGGRSPAAAFCLACAVLRAPGITVVTPGCWVAQRSAAWAVVGVQARSVVKAPGSAAIAANSVAACTPVG
jgi:hypothetical protein